jgi:hypothetical protein
MRMPFLMVTILSDLTWNSEPKIDLKKERAHRQPSDFTGLVEIRAIN